MFLLNCEFKKKIFLPVIKAFLLSFLMIKSHYEVIAQHIDAALYWVLLDWIIQKWVYGKHAWQITS